MSETFSNPEEFLAHYGVKGMKWGVRNSDSSSSSPSGVAGTAASKTVQASMAVGSVAVGRMLGGAVGSAISPGAGTLVGQYAGSYLGGKLSGKVIGSVRSKKNEVALKDLSKTLPNRNAKYTDNMVKKDINNWGPDAAQRINNSMNSGSSRSAALSTESNLQFRSSMVAVGSVFVGSMVTGPLGRTTTDALKDATTSRANANRAASYNANRQADLRGLPSAPRAARNRRGAYNITSL